MGQIHKWGGAAVAILLAAGIVGCTPSTSGASSAAADNNSSTAATGSTASEAASTASVSSAPVTVTVMQQNDASHKYFQTIGDEFTKSHPNIKVQFIGVPYANFDAKLQTMIASGTEPDVTTHAAELGYMDYYNKGLLTDLTPYIQKYGWTAAADDIPDSTMKMATINGKVYGIPLNTFTTVMMYNKNLFDKAKVAYPPSSYSDTSWTWDAMVADAKTLTSGSGANETYGLEWGWDGTCQMNDPDYFGSTFFDAGALQNGYLTANNLNQPAVQAAYQKIADLVTVDKVSPTQSYLNSVADDPFYSGKIAMEVGGAWILAGINDLPFKVGVAAVPNGGNDNVRAVTYTDPYFVMSGSKHPDQAFQYIMYLAQPAQQIEMVKDSGGNPPSSTSALAAYYSYFNSISATDMQNAIEGSYPYGEEEWEHLIVGAGQIHDMLYNNLTPVMDGTKTAQQVCPGLYTKMNALLTQIKSGKS